MSVQMHCKHVQQASGSGYSSGWMTFNPTVVGIDNLVPFLTELKNGKSITLNNTQKNTWGSIVDLNCQYSDCDTIPSGFTGTLRQLLSFTGISSNDVTYWNTNLAGNTLEILLRISVRKSNIDYSIPVFYFKKTLPTLGTGSSINIEMVSDVCLNDVLTLDNSCTCGNFSASNVINSAVSTVGENGTIQTGFFKITENTPPEPDCNDSRSSDDTQTLHFVISDGVSNAQTFDVSFNLSDGANQEIGLLSSVLSDSAFNALLNVWNSQTGCTARCQFTSGTVRSSCTVKLVCKVYGQSLKVSPSLLPPFVQLNLSEYGGINAIDRNLLIANFDPCQDTAVSYSEDVTSYVQGLQQNEDFTVGFSFVQVVPYKVVIENCTALTDYCCDDDESVPADDESLGGYTKPLIQGYGGGSSGGGGGDVDITCICTALSNINTTLSAFASANEAALGDINSTLSNMNIDIDNQCICDNLEDVVDGLGAIKDSIDDKELSVTNSPVINVAPCQPIVTNPVNNITVTPSTAQITNPVTVQPCQPIVTNPVNNITVTPSTADVNVNIDNSGIESALSDINSNLSAQSDGLICNDKGLACIIKEALNTSGVVSDSITDVIKEALNTTGEESDSITDVIKEALNTTGEESESIADVIKNKDMGTNIDVEVSPADDVNINRVYYTNQRNGDTHI
ncbi:MAG: hypothetical protein QXI16_02945 [Sulfolobaceae archaeon]